MAKPPSAIGKAKKAAAFQRRLDRGVKKLARRTANRISLNHQVESGGTRASEAVNTSDAPNPTNNTQPKENQA